MASHICIRNIFSLDFSSKNFPPQGCGVKLVTVTNHLVPRPPPPTLFSDKTFLPFNQLKISTVIDLVENCKFEKLCYKISISERPGWGMPLPKDNETKSKKIKIF